MVACQSCAATSVKEKAAAFKLRKETAEANYQKETILEHQSEFTKRMSSALSMHAITHCCMRF